jgi:hypothetical protein
MPEYEERRKKAFGTGKSNYFNQPRQFNGFGKDPRAYNGCRNVGFNGSYSPDNTEYEPVNSEKSSAPSFDTKTLVDEAALRGMASKNVNGLESLMAAYYGFDVLPFPIEFEEAGIKQWERIMASCPVIGGFCCLEDKSAPKLVLRLSKDEYIFFKTDA